MNNYQWKVHHRLYVKTFSLAVDEAKSLKKYGFLNQTAYEWRALQQFENVHRFGVDLDSSLWFYVAKISISNQYSVVRTVRTSKRTSRKHNME